MGGGNNPVGGPIQLNTSATPAIANFNLSDDDQHLQLHGLLPGELHAHLLLSIRRLNNNNGAPPNAPDSMLTKFVDSSATGTAVTANSVYSASGATISTALGNLWIQYP